MSSNALPGESPERMKVRFLSDSGDGGAAAVTLEELVEDYWSDEHGQGEMFEGLHCKVEPDLDTTATEAASDRLLENGVVRDTPRDEGAGMKHLTTRWEKTWRKRNNEREYKVRFVGREYRWQEFREDLFAPGASYCTGRIVDILSLKRRVPTFTLDCTDAFHQAPELDDMVVEPPEEYLYRLRAAGQCTEIWWKLQKQLPGRRQPGQRWVDHFTFALVDKLGLTRVCECTTFFVERQVGMEVHMDDVHGFGPDPQVEKFKEDLAAHIWFRGGVVHCDGGEYDHLKRFRKRSNSVMTIESNPKYLDAVLELHGLERAKDVPTRSVPAHTERLVTGELLDPAGTTVYRQCVGGLLYYTQDRADALYEVSILGSMLGKPTQRSMFALKRVTRYLKGRRDFVNKLELDNEVDKHVVRLDVFSDSDWAGSTDRKSQSSGALFVDGTPLYSFSRRQSVTATNSGMAEFYAG